MEIAHRRTKKYIGKKTIADNHQPINKISYSQQLSTLQNEGLQKTNQRKNVKSLKRLNSHQQPLIVTNESLIGH